MRQQVEGWQHDKRFTFVDLIFAVSIAVIITAAVNVAVNGANVRKARGDMERLERRIEALEAKEGK